MNLKSTLAITFIFFLLSGKTFAQKEANIWYFGNYAGVDFNSGAPVVLTNSSMSAFEGCASIANHNGQLLFYTDGMKVWNKNHQVMVNGTGLDGNSSSTQSGVIIPQPGPANGAIYYIFTVDAQAGGYGFRYSIVDTSLQGGLGEVTVKNVPILSPTTEKITAVSKGPGEIWVITHGWNSADFYAYILDANGLNTTPVITNVGTVHNGSTNNTIGYLKVSPDGKKLGLCVDWGLQIVEVFDFDKATGIPSNPITLMNGINAAGPYGFEFSPNSKVVYAADESGSPFSNVFQWDLQAGTPAQIIASMITMGSLSNAGALQLATDGKIYLSQTGTAYLGVVNDPDVVGTGCNFVQDAVNLQGNTCNFGLPNFVQNYFLQAAFTAEGICFGDTTFFSIVDTAEMDSVDWLFDDPNSGINDSSKDYYPYHLFTDTGSYNVILFAHFQGGYSDTDTVVFTIYPLPNTNLGNDTTICSENILVLDASFPVNSGYLWQDASTDSTYNATTAGTYYVTVTSANGCVSSDTLNLLLYPLPLVDLGNDTLMCDGSLLTLDVTGSGTSYLWQDGSVNGIFTVSVPGLYWANVTDTNSCSQIDSINVSYVPLPLLDLGNDTLICLGDSIILNASSTGVTYYWNNGTTDPTLKIGSSGIYWVNITDGNLCVNRDTFNLGVLPPPPVNIGDEIHYCFGQQAYLDATTQGAVTFLWWDGTTNFSHYVGTPGTYWVTVTNLIGCKGYDTVDVFEQPLPVVNLGADTLLCDYATLLLDADNPDDYHEWQDGSNTQTYQVSDSGTYLVTVIDKYNCISGDQIVISHQNTPMVDLGPDSLYCYGDTIKLNAYFPDATYSWQDGSANATFNVFMIPGTYYVNLSDICGNADDTVSIDFHNCQSCVNVPNVFTPNNDGVNDFFLPFHDCNVDNYNLMIFNRWGQLIWQSHDIDTGWNGKNSGTSEELGTYAWYLDYENTDKPGTTYHLQGYVVLVR
ncbi:MAG: gliding motility-associated C-terminal domain-containing protein [Chitinophagales bacterium]